MTINRTVLFDHFSWSFDAYDLAISVLERMESNDDDELYQCMDDELIYTSDQWKLMMAYQTPQDANYDDAWESFMYDLSSAISDGAIEEDDEDEEDE